MHGANNQAFTSPEKRRNYFKYSKKFANLV